MRRLVFLLALFLAACGGNSFDPTTAPLQHQPSISNVTLSPDSVSYMDAGGQVAVTAEITFIDIGLDIQALWIRMPDGTTLQFTEQLNTETGTLTEEFMISTAQPGIVAVEFWLADRAGSTSLHRYADFDVGWTQRLAGLEYSLHDVIWDGSIFVAVGGGGTVLTSVDGIDWVPRDSGTDADLFDVASFGEEIFAAGDGLLLLSTDHGENWVKKAMPDWFELHVLAGNASRIVAGGSFAGDDMLPHSSIMVSEDRGDTWSVVGNAVDTAGEPTYLIRDLVYRNGLFVAATEALSFGPDGDARVQVSSDGKIWQEIIVLPEGRGLRKITHDGSQFFAIGVLGAVFTSFDGYNWTSLRPAPDELVVGDIQYLSAASDGTRLMVAGGHWWCGALYFCDPESRAPRGIASSDGGLTWTSFNIDGGFTSRGMAYGNGRFVSVGFNLLFPDIFEGAIYSVD